MSEDRRNTIYLVRHGENPANINKEFSYKKIDYSLTPKGVLQAQQTAVFFRDKGIDEIYASPLKRARETAEIIGAELKRPVTVMENFREVNVGSLEGTPASEENWRLFFNVFRDWVGGRSATAFPEGEDYLSLWSRMNAGLAHVVGGKAGRRMIVVGHGGIFTVTMKDLCRNVDPESLLRTINHNCSVSEIAVSPTDAGLIGELINWASHDHLSGDAADVIVPWTPQRRRPENAENS